MLEIALDVHLGFLAFRRRRQRHDTEHPRADPFGDALDSPALAGRISPFEHNADLCARGFHPLLELDQLLLQWLQLALEFLGRHGRPGSVVDWPAVRDRRVARLLPVLVLALRLRRGRHEFTSSGNRRRSPARVARALRRPLQLADSRRTLIASTSQAGAIILAGTRS